MALNGAWRAIIRANGGGPGKVAEGAYHLVVCLTARGKVVSSPQRPASAPKNPTLRRSSNMRTTLASRRGTVPGATSKQTLSHRWGGVLRLRLRIPHTLGRFYAAGLTVTFSGDDPLRTSLNGVRRGYWRVRGRLTKRFGPALVPGLMDGLTRCLSEERLCSSRAAPGSIS